MLGSVTAEAGSRRRWYVGKEWGSAAHLNHDTAICAFWFVAWERRALLESSEG